MTSLQGQEPQLLPQQQQQQLQGIGLGIPSQQLHLHLAQEPGHVQGHPQYELYGARPDLLRRKRPPGRHIDDEEGSPT